MKQLQNDPAYSIPQAIESICTAYVRLVKLAQLKHTGRTYIAMYLRQTISPREIWLMAKLAYLSA